MKAVVLAAGKGVRMQSELPKVLHELNGKPLLQHVTDSLHAAGVDEIILVVGYKSELVKETMGSGYTYVLQKEQLGTGHAVLQAAPALEKYSGNIIVACGDAPLITSSSFSSLNSISASKMEKASVLTMLKDNPFGYGRIVKSSKNYVDEIIEEKDASDDEKLIKEVNTGTYLFDSGLLFSGLKNIGNDNAQNEYYLPDVIKYINKQSFNVVPIQLKNSVEGSGINSIEELKRISELQKNEK